MAKSSAPGQGLSRRDVLTAGAAVPLAAALPASGLAATAPNMVMGAHPDPTAVLEGLETLTAIEMELLEAFCARLVPTDDAGPGAREARAAHYIDHALAGPLMNQRAAYAAGLSALETYARRAKGRPFAELSPVDQDAVLHDLEGGSVSGFTPGSTAFFNLVRAHTIEGMFCDPYYGGNANFVGWDLIGYPGLRMVVTAEEQRLLKPAARRESAYSVGLFGRGERK